MDVRQWSATPPRMDLHESDNLGELLAPCPPGKSGCDALRIEADHSEGLRVHAEWIRECEELIRRFWNLDLVF